jgi:hypothetical protein
MKVLVVVATAVFTWGTAYGECVMVEPAVQPSKQNAHVVVIRDRSVAAKLRLVIRVVRNGYTSEKKVTTDGRGAVDLRSLPSGLNCITFETESNTEPRLTAYRCLEVKLATDVTASEFSIALVPAPPTLDELVKAKEFSPIEWTARKFAGTIIDPSGAGIPKAEISVYRRRLQGIQKPVKVQANDQGSFVGSLEPGTYTFVVMSPGFKSRYLGLESKEDTSEQKMSIELSIGGC